VPGKCPALKVHSGPHLVGDHARVGADQRADAARDGRRPEESNRRGTIPYLAARHCHGPEPPLFNKTWHLPDVARTDSARISVLALAALPPVLGRLPKGGMPVGSDGNRTQSGKL